MENLSGSADRDYVRLPFDATERKIKFHTAGGDVWFPRNKLIEYRLRGHIRNVDELINVIKSYNENGAQKTPEWTFSALRELVTSMSPEEKDEFFREDGILQSIQHMALKLKEILPKLKWLKCNREDSITLHQTQIASILACAFLCAFPKREKNEPSINFNTLFEGGKRSGRNSTHLEKLKCVLHYFSRIRQKQPTGFVCFYRKWMPHDKYPRWESADARIRGFTAHCEGRIEDQAECLQMDFANRVIGGGVLGWGCVQEEIRFIICPELIVARLFTEPMMETEALLIIGPERYCKYGGYADNFYFLGKYEDSTPFDEHQRRNTYVLAVDALYFRNPQDQYRRSQMLREIKKIYAGLVPVDGENMLPLATGNWGCGAFRGDPELKAALQILAASQAGRDVIYFTFGDDCLKKKLEEMYEVMRKCTVGQVYTILAKYLKDRRRGGLCDMTVAHFLVSEIINQMMTRNFPKSLTAEAAEMGEGDPQKTSSAGETKEVTLKGSSVDEGAQKRSSTTGTPPVDSVTKLPRRNSRVPWPHRWLDMFDDEPKRAEADVDLSRRFTSSLGNVAQTSDSSLHHEASSTSGRLSPCLFSDSEPTDQSKKEPSTPSQTKYDSDDLVPCTPGQDRGYEDILKFYIVHEKKNHSNVAQSGDKFSTLTKPLENSLKNDMDESTSVSTPACSSWKVSAARGPSGSREQFRGLKALEKRDNFALNSDSEVKCDYDHNIGILDALEGNCNKADKEEAVCEPMDSSTAFAVSTSSEEIPATPIANVKSHAVTSASSQKNKPMHKKRYSQTTMDSFLKKT